MIIRPTLTAGWALDVANIAQRKTDEVLTFFDVAVRDGVTQAV
jgi:hypothetical protein